MTTDRHRQRLLGTVVVAVTCVLGAGCTVSEPDPGDWTAQAIQSLSDTSSEVGTARYTLVRLREGDLWTSYAVTLLAEAEKAVSTAEESLATLQPPAGRKDDETRLLELIGTASDAVRAARVAVVGGAEIGADLVGELEKSRTELDRQVRKLSRR